LDENVKKSHVNAIVRIEKQKQIFLVATHKGLYKISI